MPKNIRSACIITIGDELLIGQVIDTNSAWIATQLNRLGIFVRRRVAVGDNRQDILSALRQESEFSELLILTGGLGPTADDITKPLLLEYFGGSLVSDQRVLDHIRFLFEKVFKRPLTERNIKQAEVPDSCVVLFNRRGTAPGMWFEKEGSVVISLPGVPHEMKGIMTDEVIPRLEGLRAGQHIVHKTLLTAGIGESALAEHIESWEQRLPGSLKLAYLPNYGMVRLRLTASGDDASIVNETIEQEFDALQALVSPWLVIDRDATMQEVVFDLLKREQKTLGTAESCTGGYIAHLMTSIAGSSAVFRGSVISYSNDLKTQLLSVPGEVIDQYGAVSEETVTAMCRGALATLKSDYVIATSGIMGPDGGSETKPVGTVWIGVASTRQTKAQRFQFRFDRARNIELTATNALNMLRMLIISETNAR
jgi:nicotinamide-nucleotide amidase